MFLIALLVGLAIAAALMLKADFADYGPTPSITPDNWMVQFRGNGETVLYTNTTASELPAGTPIIQGNLFGVPTSPIPAYKTGALAIEGNMRFPKTSGDGGMAVGTLAYWDDTNHVLSPTASGNTYVGKLSATAADTDVFAWCQVEAVANAAGVLAWGVIPSATVAATGTTSGDGPVSTGFTLVTAADATKAVTLPTASAGKTCIIKNNVAAVLKVFPATGDKINNGAATTGYLAVPASSSCIIVAYDATDWYSIPMLPS